MWRLLKKIGSRLPHIFMKLSVCGLGVLREYSVKSGQNRRGKFKRYISNWQIQEIHFEFGEDGLRRLASNFSESLEIEPEPHIHGNGES